MLPFPSRTNRFAWTKMEQLSGLFSPATPSSVATQASTVKNEVGNENGLTKTGQERTLLQGSLPKDSAKPNHH